MRFWSALMALMLSVTPVLAQSVERHGSFIIMGQDAEFAILAGDITPQTPLEFKTVMSRQPNLKTLVLSSDGGSVTGGLLLADEIHLRGINTYIPPTFGCHSACSYIFLSGASRLDQGELGVHQFYGGEDSTSQAQFVVSDILDMLARFDTPQEVISRMLRTPSDDMYIFTQAEVDRLGINRNHGQLKSLVAEFRQVPEVVLTAMRPDRGGGEETQTASTDTDTETTAPSSAPRFAIYDGVDFYGSDIEKMRTETLEQCFAACLENAECSAMTVNLDPAAKVGPNCFLKSNMGDTVSYPHAVSGAFIAADYDGVLEIEGEDVPPTDIIALE
ncbi:MAG: PAN domain-containing protein [Candidatus Devosia phytovorans]|uniref:PAN domain-containing protein n=1 Tax=Candidatus Devosia phytovorans TaxID=3121372 RepID=A0AAJ5VW84_9HYPH|nr:PAN domain-containing protein [Devosia sp.]WEK05055.1 MAG: PAN domain-containing protein [Devosia sp.]